MDGIAISLAGREMPGTFRRNSGVIDIKECLGTLQPDLVIFEMGALQSPAILSLLSERPGIQLIGLDPACSKVILLNSQQCSAPNMDALCALVQTEAGQNALLPKGGD